MLMLLIDRLRLSATGEALATLATKIACGLSLLLLSLGATSSLPTTTTEILSSGIKKISTKGLTKRVLCGIV
jgi:hypothetical protein